MAKTTKTQPFENMRCPHCGEVDSLDVKVETLTMECRACSEAITREEIADLLDKFMALFDWIDSAASFAAPK